MTFVLYIKELFLGMFCFTNNLVQSLPAWFGLASFAFLLWFPKGKNEKNLLEMARRHALKILMLFILISVILTSYSMYENKPANFATPDTLTSPVLRDMNIRIGDLTREESVIRNRTFQNCHIYGPAIIYVVSEGCVITANVFPGVDTNCVFIETTNETIVGAIALDNCVIKNCTFHKIGFIGSPEEIASLKRGFLNRSM